MIHQKGLNHAWSRPEHVRQRGQGGYSIALREPLGQSWDREIVTYPLPGESQPQGIRVSWQGRDTPCQVSAAGLSILVESLGPNEQRVYDVECGDGSPAAATPGVSVVHGDGQVVLSNGLLSLLLPGERKHLDKTGDHAVPGPILAVRRGQGAWLGRGRIESPHAAQSVDTRVIESGALWTTVEVAYAFEGGYTYRVRLRLRPDEAVCEVEEESTLPVRLWPAPRPYREIGTLGESGWAQAPERIGKPCVRPCPTSNFLLDLDAGFEADRMVTHSTGSVEIMDFPLGTPALKTYTAMRAALPFIDGAWLGVYDSRQDDLLGVVAIDLTAWGVPDQMIHPVHRTPGASAEVILLDSRDEGPRLRFPVENVRRRWLLTVCSRSASKGVGAAEKPDGQPVRLDPDPGMPLWDLYRRRGALPLDKVKDWIVDWPDAGDAHPRVFCTAEDFPAIREKVHAVPELARNYEETGHLHAADRYLMEAEPGRLAEVEAATHGKALVEDVLARGYATRIYALALSRPLRRYAMACDILWDGFTPEERREARRVCALTAYILTDGDWWQYVFREGETTYLPNFNSDVFGCAGLLGLFLSDHPCSHTWTRFLVDCLDVELPRHLRSDGGGEENVGCYMPSTWSMFYFPALWALRHRGIKDYSTDPNILAGARFFLKVIGPPDPRDEGLRQLPPIGNHPFARKALPYAPWLAAFVKGADPDLASHLMWAWRASGAPVFRNRDHSGPAADPLTRHYIFHDPSIPEVAPEMVSHRLPNVGAVLRSHDPSGEGSYLFLKAGRVHSHHDDDEGSFHYHGRGVPLALDGLPLQNGATASQHNAVTFGKGGQPTGRIEHFVSTPAADYVRTRIDPRAFCCDTMYLDGFHRSGWERQILLVKADQPGGVEYVVVKDTACGPDPCQWNLDVLSLEPALKPEGRVWFPGHPGKGFGMGLDVVVAEPCAANIVFEKGVVHPLSERQAQGESSGGGGDPILWTVVEHWLMHVPADAGSTFVVLLFPRRRREPEPVVRYLDREETMEVAHAEGRDLIFLRPNPVVDTSLDGALFRGRAGIVRERQGRRTAHALDATCLELDDCPGRRVQPL